MAEKKVLVGTIHLPPDEDNAEGHVYQDGDVPSAEHAKLITNPNAWRVETGDEETDAYVNGSEHTRELLRQAKALGVEPGKGLPRNPSDELIARAIRFAEGRMHSGETPGTSPSVTEIDVAAEKAKLDGRTREGRAAKASTSAAGS